ncbi:hypothetical protein ACH5RR_032274 [Cinchona calisaya]|uniref:Uncharacterized protein n=1 Tax=Cinchona calisaya TaxID=153742 RepID=A0ABD2YHL7_9GENT
MKKVFSLAYLEQHPTIESPGLQGLDIKAVVVGLMMAWGFQANKSGYRRRQWSRNYPDLYWGLLDIAEQPNSRLARLN